VRLLGWLKGDNWENRFFGKWSQQLVKTPYIFKKHYHHRIYIRSIARYRKRSYDFHYKKSIAVFKKAFSMCKQTVELTAVPFHTFSSSPCWQKISSERSGLSLPILLYVRETRTSPNDVYSNITSLHVWL